VSLRASAIVTKVFVSSSRNMIITDMTAMATRARSNAYSVVEAPLFHLNILLSVFICFLLPERCSDP
jgi:hypothetical protein